MSGKAALSRQPPWRLEIPYITMQFQRGMNKRRAVALAVRRQACPVSRLAQDNRPAAPIAPLRTA